jgi:hypothetical protein
LSVFFWPLYFLFSFTWQFLIMTLASSGFFFLCSIPPYNNSRHFPPLHCILVLMGCNNYTKLIPSIFQFYFISSIRYSSSSSFNQSETKPSQISLSHL